MILFLIMYQFLLDHYKTTGEYVTNLDRPGWYSCSHSLVTPLKELLQIFRQNILEILKKNSLYSDAFN